MLENEHDAQSAEWLGSSGDQLAQQGRSGSAGSSKALPTPDQRASPGGSANGSPDSPPRRNDGTGRLGSSTSCEARR